ncbi:MAG TPA: nitroreductase [Gammaproteobacteria bacterium]|nr:nitroreductase [Gammaproteobacteria bacterium]
MQTSSSAQSEDFASVLRGRRSIDLFAPNPVAADTLMAAIELASWAPNHRLTEPWRFYLVGPTTMRAVIDLAVELEIAKKGERAGPVRRARLEAVPGTFVLTSLRNEDALTERENYAACCCAAQNLMLYLWRQGIGVKWTTGAMTRQQRFYELLGIDAEKESVVGFFWYGMPKVIPTQKRRPVGEIVTELP